MRACVSYSIFFREREIVLVVAHTESVLMGVDDGVSARVER